MGHLALGSVYILQQESVSGFPCLQGFQIPLNSSQTMSGIIFRFYLVLSS